MQKLLNPFGGIIENFRQTVVTSIENAVFANQGNPVLLSSQGEEIFSDREGFKVRLADAGTLLLSDLDEVTLMYVCTKLNKKFNS